MPVYLGVDVGSISTNVVAVDTDACLVARYYGWTSGRPIEAVRQGIGKIAAQVGRSVTVEGVGVTGSGRYLIGDFIGSDVVRNEITAQATASIHIDPTVDTILEIGGQDSKFIAVENGVITDFAMNKVCAAGTGSFLEEQAERMDIDLQKDFGRLALESQAPVSCAERCTVFMEQDLAQCLQAGVDRKDLAAGLCYSIASNYLNKVAIRHKIGRNVFFQGAVAFNKGVVAALEQLLGRPVTVPPNHDVTGAIGAAMLALSASPEESRFRGFESIIRKRYELTSFVCTHCENRCSISKVDIDGQNPLFYGDRCDERYGKSRIRRSVRTCGPDLFARREEFLMRSWVPSAPGDAPTVGIPRALLFHEQLPFWRAFFTALRFRVVLSDRTNRAQVNRGVRHTPTETCFPVKVLYGHVLDLLAKDVDYLFLPTVVDHPQTRRKYAGSIRFNCPFVQTAGYMVRAGIDMREADVRVLQPTLYHGFSERRTRQALSAMGKSMGRAPADVKRALRTGEFAQQSFRRACLQAGRETLDAIRPDGMMFVLVARPYNGCDAALNLDLAKHLRELGVQSIPMDFLPLDEIDVLGEYENMYWHYGQKILAAAKIIARNRNLHAVYVSNFRCGPDAFITPFFQEIMDGKPFLHLEFDDHDADAGVVTRCEAFLDSLRNAKQTAGPVAARRKPGFCGEKTCTVYIPHMGDHAYALKAAFVAHGHPAEVMVSDDDSLRIGRQHSSGKECLPFVITTGDMVKATQAPGFDPERAAFFLASTRGPCRFGLYSDVQRIVLDKLGLSQVPIIAPNQASALLHQIRVSGPGFFRLMWRGCVAYELLGRLLREIRPYEVNAGETDRVYDVCKQDLYDTLVRSGDAVGALKRARAAFEHVPVDRSVVRPRIGIVGEVFVRMHEYSNGHVVRKIETLGGEVCLPGFQEWMYHCNHSLRQYALARGKCRLLAQVWVQDRLQKREEKRALAAVRPLLVGTKEPDTRQLWENAGTYFLPWFGEASLGIGKSVEYARTGASGIVNLMPFTCLIGSICKTQLQPFRRDYGQIPVLNLEYDGLEESAFMDDLEPFMDQARDYLGTGVIQGK